MAFLSDEGLNHLWKKILNNFVKKRDGKGLSSNDFTDEYKTKIDSTAADVNVISALVGDTAVSEQISEAVETKADKTQGIYYIEGTGDTTGVWLGAHSDITEYYPGLTIAYKIPVTWGSGDTMTLNINSLGAVSVVLRNRAKSLDRIYYTKDSIAHMTYTVDTKYGAYWKIIGAPIEFDWNAGEGGIGHIKNRTHWAELATERIFGESEYTGCDYFTSTEIPELGSVELVIDRKYTVLWDGTRYEFVCKYYADDNGDHFKGFGNIMLACEVDGWCFEDAEDTDEPFCLLQNLDTGEPPYFVTNYSDETTIDIALDQEVEVVHQLDEKYIPDTIARMEDVPHYKVTETPILAKSKVKFGPDNDYTVVLDGSLEEGKTYKVIWDDVEYITSCLVRTSNCAYIGNLHCVYGLGTYPDTGEPFYVENLQNSTQSNVLYLYPREFADGADYESTYTHTFSISEYSEDIKRIDRELLHIDSIPYRRITETPILAESTFEFTPDNDYEAQYLEGLVLEVDKTYKVIWDGVEYIRTCYTGKGSAPIIGDQSIYYGGGSTGEPFCIEYNLATTMSVIVPREYEDADYESTYTHTVSISEYSEECKKLDEKCLPDNIARMEDILTKKLKVVPKVVLPRTTYTISDGYVIIPSDLGETIEIVPNKTYQVYWDGAVYECVSSCVCDKNQNEYIEFGNHWMAHDFGELGDIYGGSVDNGIPFFVYASRYSGDNVTIISNKYEGENSIVIGIECLEDEINTSFKWVEREETVVLPEDTYFEDGNDNWFLPENNEAFTNVELIEGEHYVVTIFNRHLKYDCVLNRYKDDAGNEFVCMGNAQMCIDVNGYGNVNGVTNNEMPFFVQYLGDNVISIYTSWIEPEDLAIGIKHVVFKTSEHLPEKYLPNTIYSTSLIASDVILPKADYIESSDMLGWWTLDDNAAFKVKLIEDTPYIVSFNGVKYDCICKRYVDNSGDIFRGMGNVQLAIDFYGWDDVEGAIDNGMPFFVDYDGAAAISVCATDEYKNVDTIEIGITQATVKKLPEYCLPEGYSKAELVAAVIEALPRAEEASF